MVTARAHAALLFGVDAMIVQAQATVGADEPRVDLLDRFAEAETVERLRAAVCNSDLAWPTAPVTVTLSPPARLPAVAGDLALACAVLAAAGLLPTGRLGQTVLVGDLGLDGQIRPVRGVLPALLAAWRAGLRQAIVPRAGLAEAGLVPGLRVRGAERLSDVVAWLRDEQHTLPAPGAPATAPDPQDGSDLSDVRGQPEAVRALEVAAAGGHHLLLVGLPGSGATMLASRLPGLLSDLSGQQALEVTAIHSLAGTLTAEAPLITRPPFIDPHHSTSAPALVGGGVGVAKPGAVSRAHCGVLFLDEAAEFAPRCLEALRTAVEEGEIRLARRDGVARYPARFQLVLASPPCPCARSESDCSCSPHARRRYLARLSGPLLDRVDLRVRLRPAPPPGAPDGPVPEGTAVVRERVRAARQRAAHRWADDGAATNAEVPATVLRDALPNPVIGQVDRALSVGALTRCGAERVLRVAWTLADLAGLDRPGDDQIAEALAFRDRRAS
jgi:magnesium chelatase family protein